MNKNKEKLLAFVGYCLNHPEERFWQAIRNWSGKAYILASDIPPHEMTPSDILQLEETFYLE
jgi:hypothetical protein